MLNEFIIVGRLVANPELQEQDDKKVATITLAVPRSYKNANGEYETDFITCILWSGVAMNTTEYCKKGDLLGIKGKVHSRAIELENKTTYLNEMVAEKITFLSSKN